MPESLCGGGTSIPMAPWTLFCNKAGAKVAALGAGSWPQRVPGGLCQGVGSGSRHPADTHWVPSCLLVSPHWMAPCRGLDVAGFGGILGEVDGLGLVWDGGCLVQGWHGSGAGCHGAGAERCGLAVGHLSPLCHQSPFPVPTPCQDGPGKGPSPALPRVPPTLPHSRVGLGQDPHLPAARGTQPSQQHQYYTHDMLGGGCVSGRGLPGEVVNGPPLPAQPHPALTLP